MASMTTKNSQQNFPTCYALPASSAAHELCFAKQSDQKEDKRVHHCSPTPCAADQFQQQMKTQPRSLQHLVQPIRVSATKDDAASVSNTSRAADQALSPRTVRTLRGQQREGSNDQSSQPADFQRHHPNKNLQEARQNQHSREHREGHQTLVPAKQQQCAKHTVSQFVALLSLFKNSGREKRSRGVDSVFGCLQPVGTCTTQLKKRCLLRFLSFCVEKYYPNCVPCA